MKVIISNYREFLDVKFERQRSIYQELQSEIMKNWSLNTIDRIILIPYKDEGHAIFELYSYDAHGSVILYSFTGAAS